MENVDANLKTELDATKLALEKVCKDIELLKKQMVEVYTAVRRLNDISNPNSPNIPVVWVEHGVSNGWARNPATGQPALLGFRADGNVVWKFQ